MSYCLNPDCPQPQNPDDANFCQSCGASLWLGDRYRALHLIGQGGFGRTFLAVDEGVGENLFCVIKQFFPESPGLQGRRKAAALFRQEAEQLRQLGQHPQIPYLLDHVESPDGQYLVQEFVEGQNLEQHLRAKGTWSEAQVRSLLNYLLPVIRFVHQAQLIHRDIKPENIILPVGGDLPVLVDFGAAKVATQTALARTGTVIGSAGYIAPEQAMGRAEFTSDFYSLGVTCIHLLTGQHPFDLYSVGEDNWVWRQYLPHPVSSQLSRVLNRLIRRPTRQRYQTVDEILAELNSASLPSRSMPRSVRSRSPRNTARSEPLTHSERPAAHATLRRTASPRMAVKPQTWECRYILTDQVDGVMRLAVSPDGAAFATGGSDGAIRLWSLQTGALYHTLGSRILWFGAGHRDQISGLAFSPGGDILVSSSDDGTIKVWDLLEHRAIKTVQGHGWVISALALSPAGDRLASGGSDGTVKLWDLATAQLLQTLKPHRDRVNALVFSPDGQRLISGSEDYTIGIWDLRQGCLAHRLTAHSDGISSLAVSLDGQTLVSGSYDCTAKIWHLPSGQLEQTLAKHRDRILTVAIGATGLVATGSEDSTVQLWQLQTGERVASLHHTWGIQALAFAPDGQILVSSSRDETLKIWHQNAL